MTGFALRWWLSVAGGVAGGAVVVAGLVIIPAPWRVPYARVEPALAVSPALMRQQEVTRLRIDLDRQLRLAEIDRQLASARGDDCGVNQAIDHAIQLRKQIVQVQTLNNNLNRLTE